MAFALEEPSPSSSKPSWTPRRDPSLSDLSPVRAILVILASLLLLIAVSPRSRAFLHAHSRSIVEAAFGDSGTFAPLAWRERPAPAFARDTLDAIVFVYRNPKAVLWLLKSYRAAYPEGRLVLLCDDGCFDYSAAAAHYGATWIGRPRISSTKTGRNGEPGAPGHYLQPLQTVSVLDHLRDALRYVRTRYMLFLETDVHMRRVRNVRFNFTLNGVLEAGVAPGPGNWFNGASPVYAHLFNPSFDTANFAGGRAPYGGQGGTVFAAEFLRSIVNQPPEQLNNDLQAYFGCSTTMGVDYFFTAFVYRYNGTLGPYEGYLVNPDSDDHRSAFDVVHPDKSAYDVELTAEEFDVLGPNYTQALYVPEPKPPNHAPIHDVNDWPPCSPREGVKYFLGDSGLDKTRWKREWWDAP